ncbi:FAD-dependent oxidoreductase [Streptomyces sp. NBC_01022]|uniref:FAD-dependent oxidoreductase n=1 Tax=Streptomyces sp. NBC_01022 TaxID=2903723 RepID=UPI002DD7D962|nr:FAD-dependent oxidoreductase [Streptomyces sp. NBC_01022]WRZ78842.1 NAD(P)/FAD-dependent oxidoreductase [Streptomyces sp. NBC_01022]WRZ86837.1 NAD(P)/FAD-dependent oxidoreductase [Streptomyces sp. NBC_01022]
MVAFASRLDRSTSCRKRCLLERNASRLAGRRSDSGERLSVGREADIVVVGAGPGGIACAIAAAEGGSRVVLLEKTADIGRGPAVVGRPSLGRGLLAPACAGYRGRSRAALAGHRQDQ